MILLYLTDRTQDLQGMEYVPIPQLNLDLIPGSKVLIKGPVECRRGIIMLRPNSIVVLGGEVEDLVQRNAPENVLGRLINKRENPNPVYGTYTHQTTNGDSTELEGIEGNFFIFIHLLSACETSSTDIFEIHIQLNYVIKINIKQLETKKIYIRSIYRHILYH